MTSGDYETFRQVPLVPGDYFDGFALRLARENLWTRAHAERVIEEYRRFLFLAFSAKAKVTPSDAVDQVWHLHRKDAVGYRRFCVKACGRWLDHVPNRGAPAEAGLVQEQYFRTLSLYRTRFGSVAPDDIWPGLAKRFGALSGAAFTERMASWLFLVTEMGLWLGAVAWVAAKLRRQRAGAHPGEAAPTHD